MESQPLLHLRLYIDNKGAGLFFAELGLHSFSNNASDLGFWEGRTSAR